MKIKQVLNLAFLIFHFSFGHLTKFNYNKIHILKRFTIIPGTKWCGIGDITESKDELGLHKSTDSCCREHDLCDEKIIQKETKYGLTNKEIYSISSCSCDKAFRKCLKKVNTSISRFVGHTYFNTLNVKCVDFNYKIKKCLKWKGYFGFLYKRCVKYQLDPYTPKQYQFFNQELW